MRASLMLALLLVGTAQAGGVRGIEITATDRAGQGVPYAVVLFRGDRERHPVNPSTSTWGNDVLYLSDDSELLLIKGVSVDGWVVAPGYQPTPFTVQIKGKGSRLDVPMAPLDVEPTNVPLPTDAAAREVRIHLADAARALAGKDFAGTERALNAADLGRVTLEGEPYVQSTLAILELRTLMAHSAWYRRAQALTDEEYGEADVRAMEASRGVTRGFAQDWLDFVRAGALPAGRALAFCQITSVAPERCQ